jgi:hypothetical protein
LARAMSKDPYALTKKTDEPEEPEPKKYLICPKSTMYDRLYGPSTIPP